MSPWCPRCTPDGTISEPGLDNLLDDLLTKECDGIVVGGTTGESPTLTDVEATRLVRAVAAQSTNRARVVAGIGTYDTAASIHRCGQRRGNVVAERNAELIRAVRSSDLDSAKAIQRSLIPLVDANMGTSHGATMAMAAPAQLGIIPHATNAPSAARAACSSPPAANGCSGNHRPA